MQKLLQIILHSLKRVNDIVIEKGQDYNVLNGISAYDKEDGDLTHKITVDGHVDTSKVGTYKVRYNVIDSEEPKNHQHVT